MPVIGFLGSRRNRRAHLAAAFRQRPERSRLCRRPQRGDRVSLGRGSIRPAAGTGGRSGSPTGGRDRCRWRHRRHSRPRLRPRRFRSCSSTASDPVEMVSSPASTGRAATSRASAIYRGAGAKRLEIAARAGARRGLSQCSSIRQSEYRGHKRDCKRQLASIGCRSRSSMQSNSREIERGLRDSRPHQADALYCARRVLHQSTRLN